MRPYSLHFFFVMLLTACGSFRGGSGGYQSNSGGWRTPSDYLPSDNGYITAKRLPQGQSYIPSQEFRLYWPVKNVRINRGFKDNQSRPHQGVDLGGTKGTPILAAHEGVVIYAGREFRGYGNMVIVEYNHEWATLYAHLNSISVDEGRILKPGDPVGSMGRTGRATGIHLHFELIHKKNPVDPLPYFTRNSRMASR